MFTYVTACSRQTVVALDWEAKGLVRNSYSISLDLHTGWCTLDSMHKTHICTPGRTIQKSKRKIEGKDSNVI